MSRVATGDFTQTKIGFWKLSVWQSQCPCCLSACFAWTRSKTLTLQCTIFIFFFTTLFCFKNCIHFVHDIKMCIQYFSNSQTVFLHFAGIFKIFVDLVFLLKIFSDQDTLFMHHYNESSYTSVCPSICLSDHFHLTFKSDPQF